ncbi:hypothetical protein [Corallococcus llansteffanensis]|uniref:hypothetical protein n=1 Tax=Corallococcus llansteffanensis TaxID=2316731 RepID=UPI001FC9B242|nr:hypothetical protein [Corallococcus llansteffanensis]
MSLRTTLLDPFSPPSGLMGQTAILVSMSGTEGFLRSAMHRFTGLGRNRRTHSGCPFAYLFLDAHPTTQRQKTYGPLTIPGLHEFQPRVSAGKNLLHAKLALLAFGPGRHTRPSILRLAVTTANWTERSARHQLELLWMIDVHLDRDSEETSEEDLSDLAAARAFIQTLAERYHVPRRGQSRSLLARRYHDLLDKVDEVAPRSTRPRFMASWDESLLSQLQTRHASQPRKNLLMCGSGFFEEPAALVHGRKPDVLRQLETLVSSSAMRVLTANPKTAGAVAPWWQAQTETDGWHLVLPLDAASRASRDLHAKFIYVGYRREASCSNGWLYLGSGNLSRRGLLLSAATQGNIETGVVLDVPGPVEDFLLMSTLFLSSDPAPTNELSERNPSPEESIDLDSLISVPPILRAWARSDAPGGGPRLELAWRDDLEPGTTVRIRWASGEPDATDACVELQPSAYLPFATAHFPATLDISNEQGTGPVWTIPVESELGHYCLPPPSPRSFEEALAALLEFPIDSEGDEDTDTPEGSDPIDPEEPSTDGPPRRHIEGSTEPRQYPLHTVMEFLEGLGTHQSGLLLDQLEDWLLHLETLLPATFTPGQTSGWKGLGLDLMETLLAPGFRPPGMTSPQARRYRSIIEHSVQSWGLRV